MAESRLSPISNIPHVRIVLDDRSIRVELANPIMVNYARTAREVDELREKLAVVERAVEKWVAKNLLKALASDARIRELEHVVLYHAHEEGLELDTTLIVTGRVL